MLINNNAATKASEDLIAIVDEFNKRYQEWMKDTGCRSTFGWKYGIDQTIKTMEVQGIDAIVYRKPPPDFQSIEKTLTGKS